MNTQSRQTPLVPTGLGTAMQTHSSSGQCSHVLWEENKKSGVVFVVVVALFEVLQEKKKMLAGSLAVSSVH